MSLNEDKAQIISEYLIGNYVLDAQDREWPAATAAEMWRGLRHSLRDGLFEAEGICVTEDDLAEYIRN
jgi:hypothetical protein